MWLITDDEEFAIRALGRECVGTLTSADEAPAELLAFASELAPKAALFGRCLEESLGPGHVLVIRRPSRSQYDLALEWVGRGEDFAVTCIAGEAEHFHGHHGRSWSAVMGNVHLTMVIKPERSGDVRTAGAALVAIPSVAVCDVLKARGVAGSGIKWVNDVLIGDDKVAGVLTHTSLEGSGVSAVVYGVGLNVEKAPEIAADPAVSGATSVARSVSDARLEQYVLPLIEALEERTLSWSEGGALDVIAAYREDASIIGREVEVIRDPRPRPGEGAYPDPVVVRRGIVTTIDDELQVHLEGDAEPVRSGRLVMIR